MTVGIFSNQRMEKTEKWNIDMNGLLLANINIP